MNLRVEREKLEHEMLFDFASNWREKACGLYYIGRQIKIQ